MKTVQVLISGKVQGVFFRDSARKVANKLGVTGWIKNRPDEKVEAMVSGMEKEVQAFVEWCRSGPERAEVEEVLVSEKEQTHFERFEIVRSF
ncbi:MAG: acylphosphatase [Ginsengibacter sp.]|jgi:acylphosphatase|nr:acylphosphatase [Hanamia sp.]